MELEQAIEMLRNIVKNNSTNDDNHFDLTLVPADKKAQYSKALVVAQLAIKDGKITRDEFLRQVHIAH